VVTHHFESHPLNLVIKEKRPMKRATSTSPIVCSLLLSAALSACGSLSPKASPMGHPAEELDPNALSEALAVDKSSAKSAKGIVSPSGAVAYPVAPRAASAPAAVTTPAISTTLPLPAPGAAPSAQVPSPSNAKAFWEVVRNAKRIDGIFTMWQKDDKVWMELEPSQFNKPYFLSPKFKSGIGENRLFGGLMADEMVIEFRRVHQVVQMLARNTEFVAQAGSATNRAVEAAFSPSLLASTVVLSQPHPERKSVLIEVNSLFVSDLLSVGMLLQRQYRQGYMLDVRNSAITNVRATPEAMVIETLNHYATGSINLPPPGTPAGPTVPSVPRSVPDPRSLFLNLHYSISKLPEVPMHARKSDQRVGLFSSSVMDFTNDLTRSPRTRYVNRWRLEKRFPSLPSSEPIAPIVFWLDASIPEKYRSAITAGVLEWNKAFEKIGFKQALQVEVQAQNTDWDTLDLGRASIRWMTNASPSFGAVGPSHVDPRSGEILDADIGIESLSTRNVRSLRNQVLSDLVAMKPNLANSRDRLCNYADQAAEQLEYGLEALIPNGDGGSSSESEAFVQAYLKDTTMHEVGHTLGLRHNFRASRLYNEQQLSDPIFTAAHGISGSVMEYTPINLAEPGARPTTPFNTTLGPYDYWAIEYAYKPLVADQEAVELAKIAARSAQADLAYGTDEDMFLGVDPETLSFDLGSDVLAFARKRLAIAKDVMARQERRPLAADQNYALLRRSVLYALRDMARTAGILTRQIGGIRTLRDYAGSGREPLVPSAAEPQREALSLLASGFLSADSFKLSPALLRKLSPDFEERSEALYRGELPVAGNTEFSLASHVVDLQRSVLAQLLSDAVARRLLDSETQTPKSSDKKPLRKTSSLHLSELYQRLDSAVWSELKQGGDIAAVRRELQKEHIQRVANLLLQPNALSRADARSLLRMNAQSLLQKLKAASRNDLLSPETQAHLQDSAQALTQALSAPMLRLGV
jgi:Met-zincin/Domain of unknown function (DUF5117)